MSFIDTIPEQDAGEEVRRMYEDDRKTRGYVPNYSKIFSHRPKVKEAWNNLQRAIRGTIDTRRYELVTVAAARALKSSYCMLAHGSVLLNQFCSPDQVASIARDFNAAGLTPAEVAMMAFADKLVRNATAVTRKDIEELRQFGFTDPEIFDITVTATARCFFSKTLDALGAEPDRAYLELDQVVRESLTVGRPISGEPT